MARPVSPGRRHLARVFLVSFLVFAYFMPRWADWNIDSRLDLVHAVVDDHSLQIDRYHWNTWDKAVYKGHYYSDKAPGTALLGVVVYGLYAAARATPGASGALNWAKRSSAWDTPIRLGQAATQNNPAPKGTNLGGCQNKSVRGNVQYIPWGNRLYPPFQDWALSKWIVTVGVDALQSALFVTFFFWFVGFFVAAAILRWGLSAAYAFGTVALPYSTVFYSHQLVAGYLFVAFALLWLWKMGRVGGWAAPVAGFLLGFSFFTEYTVILIMVVVGAYALWVLRRKPRLIAGMAVAGAVPVIGLFAYSFAQFGNPVDTGYTHDFCWSSAQAAGFSGFTYPKGGALWDLTFGPYRGLLFMSPFLLLATPGAWFMGRRGYRLEAAVCLIAGIGFILAIASYWGWNGGRVDGPRYLVPMVPFLAFPVIFYLDVMRRRLAGMGLSVVLGVWSFAVTWALFVGGADFPTSWLRNPLTEYSLPALARNDIAPNAGYFLGLTGWQSLLPLVALLLIVAAWPQRPVRSWWRRPALRERVPQQ